MEFHMMDITPNYHLLLGSVWLHIIWADSNAGHSKLGPKEDEGVINLIQAIKG